MNPWLQNWDWEWATVAVLAWVLFLAVLLWLLAGITTRPPRHR